MSWSDDQKTPLRSVQSAAAAQKRTPHPAKALMDQRWEERRARRVPPTSEPTLSSIRVRTLTPHEPPGSPPPIPPEALATSRTSTAHTHVPAADSGRAAEPTARDSLAFLGNPQRALLLIALGASALLLTLLYFGNFLH